MTTFENLANVEAEAAFLGAVLIDNSTLNLADGLRADDFAEPLHARIFDAITRRVDRGETVNPVLLAPEFRTDPTLAALGGIGYLARLTADGQGLLAPRELAKQIRELAMRRRRVDWLDTERAACADMTTPLCEISLPDDIVASERTPISATPYSWRDPATIPPRPWIMGRWLLRRVPATIIAPGGVGKTTLIASVALSLASGRNLLGKDVWGGPQRAWVWNLEDDGDEMARAIAAAALAHGIEQSDCGDRLFIDSGLSGRGLCTAVEDRDGFRIIRPEIEALTAELIGRRIDALFVDPFISSHAVGENNNSAIDAVAKEWGRVATAANCAIGLSHHARKQNGERITAESSRGASALVNAARIALVCNRMSAEEGGRFGIEDEQERRRYFTVHDDKHNRAPAEAADWFQLVGIDLGNGDSVAAARPWEPPQPFDGVTIHHLRDIQTAIAAGEWRENWQAETWAGRAVASVLGLDHVRDRKRLMHLIRVWIENDTLRVVEREATHRKMRKFIEIGAVVDPVAPPKFSGAD